VVSVLLRGWLRKDAIGIPPEVSTFTPNTVDRTHHAPAHPLHSWQAGPSVSADSNWRPVRRALRPERSSQRPPRGTGWNRLPRTLSRPSRVFQALAWKCARLSKPGRNRRIGLPPRVSQEHYCRSSMHASRLLFVRYGSAVPARNGGSKTQTATPNFLGGVELTPGTKPNSELDKSVIDSRMYGD